MAKLKDDQIRWILSLDAKGVQGELVQVSSTINNLKEENKGLQQEMKTAEKAMNDAAAAMARMEDAGKTNTKQYQDATETYNSNAAALVELKSKIDQNNQSIEEAKAKFDGLTQTLSVNDMTMNQLRQRAAELQKQMNSTSQNLDEKAYNALQKQLEEVKGRMYEVQNSGKSMLSTFAAMNNPIGSAAKAVQGFIQVLNYLAEHPIVAVIALIVYGLMELVKAIKNAISQNEEMSDSLNRIMAPLKALFDWLVDIIGKAITAILQFVESVINGLMKLVEYLPFIGDKMKKINEKAREAVELEKEKQRLVVQHRENIVENAKRENEIAILRDKAAQKDKYNLKERIQFLKDAIAKENEILKSKQDEAKAQLRILEIELSRNQANTELRDKIAEQKALVMGLETEFYNKTRRDQKQVSSLILESQREVVQAAKDALDKRLKDEENALNESINQLKQARKEGAITEQEYNKQVDQLTIDSLNRKINIKGQEKDKILQLQSQILDAEIKQQTEADKELLEALTKANKNQLDLIDSSRNTQLQQLQDTESDQKIYALRAAEIEAQAAKAREDVIRAFGTVLQNAEFQNNKIRVDAIEKNGKDITNAEAKTLNDQANLRKLFAKTTADFERQYNIKTWEQRKEDELLILQKQYDEKLLSEETYQLAVNAIEKKYQDEKLKIRQQYAIASMDDLYNSEMEALQEQYDKKLLSEEEFQQAQLQIKLKYAQQYAQQEEQLIQAGSNAVKAIEEAKTAQLDAEYTKRQSALTEQYNQGIISQEQYNQQKEQLDYEQKKKELDLQKKYADVNFAMQVAQIVATTAQGIITAWATSMQLGPIAGTIMAAALTVLLGVTSAMQISKAKAERDRVKAMTLESPGGGSSTPQTGTIQLKEGLAEGGPNMADGGYTKQGNKYEVAGYLPVHGGEYVIASDELKQPVIADMARAIERERRKRTNKNSVSGFADGGDNNSTNIDSNLTSSNGNAMIRILAILDRLESGDIVVQTNYGITELESEQKRKMEAESKFTRA